MRLKSGSFGLGFILNGPIKGHPSRGNKWFVAFRQPTVEAGQEHTVNNPVYKSHIYEDQLIPAEDDGSMDFMFRLDERFRRDSQLASNPDFRKKIFDFHEPKPGIEEMEAKLRRK